MSKWQWRVFRIYPGIFAGNFVSVWLGNATYDDANERNFFAAVVLLLAAFGARTTKVPA